MIQIIRVIEDVIARDEGGNDARRSRRRRWISAVAGVEDRIETCGRSFVSGSLQQKRYGGELDISCRPRDRRRTENSHLESMYNVVFLVFVSLALQRMIRRTAPTNSRASQPQSTQSNLAGRTDQRPKRPHQNPRTKHGVRTQRTDRWEWYWDEC